MAASLALVMTLDQVIGAPPRESSNWPRWRGPNDSGSNTQGTYPVRFSAEQGLLWKTALPDKGCSTPIVWNQQIYLTTPSAGQDAVIALDWQGKQLWLSTVGPESAGRHRNGSGSNPSPVTDGDAIFVLFKSGNLAAVDLNGRVLWKKNLIEAYGKSTLYWDYGSSPVLTEKAVVVSTLHQGESYLAAFDKRSGELQWKVARNYTTPVENDHSYATPISIRHAGREALLVWGAEHLTAHDASSGQVVWSCGAFNPEGKANWVAVSSPVVVGDIAVVPFGRGSRLHGIKLGGSGDVTTSHRAWLREGTGTFVPSPVEYRGKVYMVRDRGEVECVDPVTGQSLWTGEFPKGSASFYASPAVADGKIYAPREDGVVFVGRVDGKFEMLATNDMGERVIASPVPVAGRILLRGEKTLFCVGSNRP